MFDFSALKREDLRLAITTDMKWQDQQRYSRQKKRIPIGGLVGTLKRRGDLMPFGELLEAGQWLLSGRKPPLAWADTGLNMDKTGNTLPGS
jgi:hypothetical protein